MGATVDCYDRYDRLEKWLAPFMILFTWPTWHHLLVLAAGAILTTHRRTVAAGLWVTGRGKNASDDDHTPSGGSSRGGEKLAEMIAAIQGKRDRQKALLAELERTGTEGISLTDPDAHAMARMTKVGVGYNVQLAVDVKHKLIAEQAVSNQVLDLGLLAQTATAAMEALGVDRIEAVADRGYFKIEDIEACEAAGITPYVPIANPRPRRA